MKSFCLPLLGILEADLKIDPQGDGGNIKYYLSYRTVDRKKEQRNPRIYLCIRRQDGDLAIIYDMCEVFDEQLFNLPAYETA